MSETTLDTVKFSRLKHFIEQVEKECDDAAELEITFECLVGSFYPNVLKNIQSALAREHTLGFIEGRNSLDED